MSTRKKLVFPLTDLCKLFCATRILSLIPQRYYAKIKNTIPLNYSVKKLVSSLEDANRSTIFSHFNPGLLLV